MFRRPRRPFRPMPGRIPPRMAAHQQMLRKAFQARESDDPAALAKTFSDLAAQAARNGHPRQAANLYAQSAHRWLDANNVENAQSQAELAMAAFQEMGMEKRLQEFQIRFNAHKQQPGKPMKDILHEEQKEKSLPSKSLPAVCTQCGAPVRSDEVEWVDDQSAECGFCGSIIKITAK